MDYFWSWNESIKWSVIFWEKMHLLGSAAVSAQKLWHMAAVKNMLK